MATSSHRKFFDFTPLEPGAKLGLQDALKLFIGVIIWWACSFASQAISANVDFAKLGEYGTIFGLPHLVSVQLWGFLLGALKGFPMAIQVIVTGLLGIQYVPPFVNWTTNLTVSRSEERRVGKE